MADRDLPDVRRPARPLPAALLGRAWGLLAWGWRLVIGAALCANLISGPGLQPFFALLLKYLCAAVVIGWTYRWMQAVVIRGWWQRSRFGRHGSFRDYCDSQGLDAPSPRPRWFVRERIAQTLALPDPRGHPPTRFRKFLRLLTTPWHSLWLNLRIGVAGILCVYLLTGWGSLLMVFGWEFGWRVSFEKVYELAGVGLAVSALGVTLFCVATCYVVMAMVHQAVTGDGRAFFDVRFVWRLIRAKLAWYAGLAYLFTTAALPVGTLQARPFAPDFIGNQPGVTPAEVFWGYRQYLFNSALAMFVVLLFLRHVAARIYRSAVLTALRQGHITRDELHPRLRRWLGALDVLPAPQVGRRGLPRAARTVGGFVVCCLLCFGTFLGYALMIFPLPYAGEFLMYHPVEGFLNHFLVQFPTFDMIPTHLRLAAGL